MRSALFRFLPVAGLISLFPSALAQNSVTTVAFTNPATTDNATAYDDSGTLQNSLNNNPGGAMTGTFAAIPGVSWTFRVGHDAGNVTATVVANATIKLQGEHRAAPHGAGEINPNVLPTIFAKPLAGLKPGKSGALSVWGGVPHIVGKHLDYYSITGEITNTTLGATTTLTTTARVRGKHCDKELTDKQIVKDLLTLCAKNSSADYNAANQMLTLTLGSIDVIDRVGGSTDGVAPEFVGDPVLSGIVTITPIAVQFPPNPNGSFTCGGGTITITDPSGLFAFEASFDSFTIANTSRTDRAGAFGLLISGSLNYSIDDPPGYDPPPCLAAFADMNVDGNNISGWEQRYIVLTLATNPSSPGLIALTNGFTQSVSNVPIGVCVSGTTIAVAVPTVTEWGLILLSVALLSAAALILHRRSRFNVATAGA